MVHSIPKSLAREFSLLTWDSTTLGQARVRKSISVTNEVRVELYHQAHYNKCVKIIDLRALTEGCQ